MDKLSTAILLRVTPAQRTAYRRAAVDRNMSVSAWLRAVADVSARRPAKQRRLPGTE